MGEPPMPVTAPGALLWLVHALLQTNGWSLVDATAAYELSPSDGSDAHGLEGDVNLLPPVVYSLADPGAPAAEIAVRALSVGSSLFVHFVAADKSLRLPLKVNEYVSRVNSGPRREGAAIEQDLHQRRVSVGGWLCNRETLSWRLARNVLPEFPASSEEGRPHIAPGTAQDAELSRLSDPLVRRIGCFLRGDEFIRLSQTDKRLHCLRDDRELWTEIIGHEFPGTPIGAMDHPKTLYISSWRRRRSWQSPQWWIHRQPGWPEDRFGELRGPFSWVPPFMRSPPTFPHHPTPPNRPLSYGFIDADDEMWPVFEPRYSWRG